jgi:tetratricopeptide (TPR) repeat protein
MLSLECRGCGAQLELEDRWAGRKGRCPQCGAVLQIPRSSPPPLPSERANPVVSPSPPQTKPEEAKPVARPRGVWIAAAAAAAVVAILVVVIVALSSGKGPQEQADGSDSNNGASSASTDHSDTDASPGEAKPAVEETVGGKTHPKPPDLGPDIAPVATRKDPPSGFGGLTGVSRRYDDFQCRQIQAQHSVAIPAGATILEVDGVRLPIARPGLLAASPAPLLFLPRGTHAVCFRPSDRPVPVAIASNLSDEYQAMRKFFGVGSTIRGDELTTRAARVMDVHSTPFLLNFIGAKYASQGQWDVAERKFRQALCVNPTFSPAHLNLAVCFVRRERPAEAARQIDLADAFNVGNVFGLAAAIDQQRRRSAALQSTKRPIDAGELSYASREAITEEDRRLTALMEAAGKYAVREEERAKVLNNLAVHYAESGRPELALHHFHNALAVLLRADPERRYGVARQIFVTMSDVCRKAGFGEADEYRQMSVSLSGATRSEETP